MKDAKGHGSDSHGGDVGAKLYSLMKPPSMIPGYPRADAAHQAGVRSLPDDPDALGHQAGGVRGSRIPRARLP